MAGNLQLGKLLLKIQIIKRLETDEGLKSFKKEGNLGSKTCLLDGLAWLGVGIEPTKTLEVFKPFPDIDH